MAITDYRSDLSKRVQDFVLEGFMPRYDQVKPKLPTNPTWKRLRELGSELWLDSGDIDEIGKLWTQEFTALTTNNTLLNKEVQKGIYDEFLISASELLEEYPQLTDRERRLELAFIVNARHALRLVEEFDAFVSVEEHTDLASDVEGSVNYARRYFAICPERFYVKIPFSAAGVLATRRVAREGIPVNHTLGFSARQNYLVASIAKPAFVNVFLGRLNSFIVDNDMGDGECVGERATIASQQAIREVRRKENSGTRQIAASLRTGEQVRDLAGVDVLTIPTKVAKEFLDLKVPAEKLRDRTAESYDVHLNEDIDPDAAGVLTLWEVDDAVRIAVNELAKQDVDKMTADQLIDFLRSHSCGDLLYRWNQKQMQTSYAEGKIPDFPTWRGPLAEKKIGLDTLMNLAGWSSFAADQKAMDERIIGLLAGKR